MAFGSVEELELFWDSCCRAATKAHDVFGKQLLTPSGVWSLAETPAGPSTSVRRPDVLPMSQASLGE